MSSDSSHRDGSVGKIIFYEEVRKVANVVATLENMNLFIIYSFNATLQG